MPINTTEDTESTEEGCFPLCAIHEGRVIYDKGFSRMIIPQAKSELEIKGIRRIRSAWVWPVKRLKGID